MMEAKKYAYAAVGAPVALFKKAQVRIEDVRVKAGEGASALSKDVLAQFNAWAKEGENLVTKLGETKKLDEITSKVDLDQAKDQVSKLRDQLEDLLATWKANFRPVGREQAAAGTGAVKPVAAKPVAAKPVAAKPVAKKTVAKKPAAKAVSTTKKPAAKKATTKAARPATEKVAVKVS